MAKEKFYLDFISDGYGKVQIDEPIGYGNTFFELKQKDKGYGRDISFAGGEENFEFNYYREHYIDKVLYYNHKFGFEAKVNLIIEVLGIENIVGELDFATATTDDFQYFKCKVIQDADYQIINRRRETKVDLMSAVNIDGDAIDPIVPKNMLLLNKPIYQVSEWNIPTPYNRFDRFFNAYQAILRNILKSDVSDTFSNTAERYGRFDLDPSITLTNNAKRVSLKITNLNFEIQGNDDDKNFKLVCFYGRDLDVAKEEVLLDNGWAKSFYINYSGEFVIGDLKRGDSIWVYLLIQKDGNVDNKLNFNLISCDAKISITSYAYNSVTPTFRLIDVMRQVIKSISGLDVYATRFDMDGEFNDNLLFNGNFLRNITSNGFKISLKDIDDSLMELNCDYEIAHDGRIFFGSEKDFYTDTECGFFDNTQFSEMNKTANPRFTVNEFWYTYKRFQSLKEKEEINSADVIHGESKMTFFNKRVENKKEISVEWCRDAFLIEENRRKSLEISNSTASQNDDDVFIIDSINTTEDREFNEVTELQHTFISITQLSLKTKGDVNFVSMGMTIGGIFNIKAPDNNTREYTIYEVSNSEIKLTKNSGADLGASSDGIRSTSYSYILDKDFIPFTNYTNQGITAFNLQANESYSNLRYSIGRNIFNYWKEYIATCNLYWKDKEVINSWYKNNPTCTTVYQGKTIIEAEPFNTSLIKPILSPFLYNQLIFANVEFEDYVELIKQIRTRRGFIRFIDNNKKVIRVYPIDIKWGVEKKELTIKGEEKYEPTYMTIDTSNLFTLINNETRIMNITWDIVDDKLTLYDSNRFRLYNPVWWNEVSINGAKPISVAQLKEWLKLIP
jgi:hypothetical protein